MSEKIRVLIIDDERYSRDELKHLLGQANQIEVVGEADSGEKGVMMAIQTQPDVVFVDVEMPKMNGIETAKAMKELKKSPLIVFATAYPDFAAEAFRLEATDYLLKPFEEDELKDTISRLKRLLLRSEVKQDPLASLSKLAIEGNEEIIYLDPNNILYIYRDDKTTRIVGIESEYESKTTLKDLEIRLSEYPFFRIHKSYLVNLEYIKKLIPWFNGAFQLELENRKELLPVSRNYVKELRAHLEI